MNAAVSADVDIRCPAWRADVADAARTCAIAAASVCAALCAGAAPGDSARIVAVATSRRPM